MVADRILASRLGDFAVRALSEGNNGAMAGEIRGQLTLTPFLQTYEKHHAVPEDYLQLLATMAS